MMKLIGIVSDCAIVFGALSLIPVALESSATLPLWASLSLIGAGIAGNLATIARRNSSAD